MPDRAEVISQLERCTLQTDLPIHTHRDACAICHYKRDGRCNFTSLMTDALELLKEQEPVEPKLVGVNMWACGKCGALLGWEDFSQSRHCPVCGRKVDWNV